MVARNEEEKAMGYSEYGAAAKDRRPWNVGRMVGAKRALKPQQVWAIRFWLDREGRLRDRAMFDLAIDSKLRGCDVVKVKIGDLVSGGRDRKSTRLNSSHHIISYAVFCFKKKNLICVSNLTNNRR